MNFRTTILFACLILFGLGSCMKEDNFDPEKQAVLDDAAIAKYLQDNNIAAEKHSSGIYYQILEPGTGNVTYAATTSISARYKGRLLDGTVFDPSGTNPISFQLGGVIAGWQIGIQFIQKGGKIRLFIPSAYAYGPSGYGSIPGNAVLDFDIELVDAQN